MTAISAYAIRTLFAGSASVYRGSDHVGDVQRVEYAVPNSDRPWAVKTVHMWVPLIGTDITLANPLDSPSPHFSTRRSAAEYVAEHGVRIP